MKKLLIAILLCLPPGLMQAQVLLRNNQGEQLFSSRINDNLSNTLININTSTTSIGADYSFTDRNNDLSNYHIIRFGIAGKATDGIAPLIKQGQLSPGVSFSGSWTKVRFLSAEIINHKFFDWVSINAGYAADKYKLYRSDTVFAAQFTNQNFRGFNMNVNYNMVFGLEERDNISISLGYARKNNNGDLTSVDVEDYQTTMNSTATVTRKYGSTQTGKQGKYKEYDTYPITITYVNLPKFQPQYLNDKKEKETTVVSYIRRKGRTDTVTIKTRTGSTITTYSTTTTGNDTLSTVTKEMVNVDNPLFKSVKVGYALYFNTYPSNNGIASLSNLGGTIFLASPNKDNVLTSRVGLNFEFGDFFDVKHANNGAFSRLGIGLTVNFSL